MDIKFTNIRYPVSDEFKPQPATRFVPNWYKDSDGFINKVGAPDPGDGTEGVTIKKCMPVFDAITSGYIIPTPFDFYVTRKDGVPYYQWTSSDLEFIQFHPIQQVPNHPESNGYPIPKFLSPWSIETPPGYSCLFVTPFHQDLIYSIFSGVVDTDKYTDSVNFPFVLTDLDFEGVVPAGTPMAQVIPFKRDSWQTKWGTEEDKEKAAKTYHRVQSQFFNVYKNLWRSKKEYL
jgi:hypothetical protein